MLLPDFPRYVPTSHTGHRDINNHNVRIEKLDFF